MHSSRSRPVLQLPEKRTCSVINFRYAGWTTVQYLNFAHAPLYATWCSENCRYVIIAKLKAWRPSV